MSESHSFADALNAVEQLSADEQVTLLEVMQRRIAERRRKALAAEVSEAQQEFASGGCRPVQPNDILDEIAP